jgi:peptidoglycan hydrolase-like protein with peptidoglycan-binding domain
LTAQFDQSTLAAVQAFQTAQGLTPDGMVGPMTRNVLLSVLAIVGPEVCLPDE